MHYLWPWLDVALLSQAYVLHVFLKCWKTSWDFTDMPQSDTNSIRLAAMATAPVSFFFLWPFPTQIIHQRFKNYPNYVNSRDGVSAFCSRLWPFKPKQPGRTFSRQYVNLKSKELKMIKDSTQSFAKFHTAKEKRQFNSADKAWEDQSRCAATPSLHVDINLKESRQQFRYP